MENVIVYIHGKGGSAAEAEHYQRLFPGTEVIGFDYAAQTPWEAQAEFAAFFTVVKQRYGSITAIANSIGAFFTLHALPSSGIEQLCLISPIADMEALILNMLQWAGTTEEALARLGTIETGFGETLSWEYLSWVRAHPICLTPPTYILYGSRDHLQSPAVIKNFAGQQGAALTVMEGGEHWFHTPEQMAFLDNWITSVLAGL